MVVENGFAISFQNGFGGHCGLVIWAMRALINGISNSNLRVTLGLYGWRVLTGRIKKQFSSNKGKGTTM